MRRRGSFFAGSFASRSMIESGIFQPRSALALGENRLYAVLMAKIAYIGLGIMGAPMAGHLVRAGHDVTVFNRSMAKTRAWVEKHGGEAAVSPAQAAQEADIVISCVGTDDDLTAITLGQDGAFRRSEEHTSELQSLMRISYAVFCLKKKTKQVTKNQT